MAADLPWRLPTIEHRYPRVTVARGRPLVDPAPPGMAGEFDSLVDPNFPRFSSANLSEAFPGPMTALSLDVSHDCLGSNAAGMVDFLGIRDAELAHVQSRFAVAVFGHRFYTSVSAIRLMAEAMPGADPDEMEAQFLGQRPPADDGASSRATMSWSDLPATLGLLGRVGPRIAGLPAEIRRSEQRASRVPRRCEQLADISDERLQASILHLHDQLVDSWWASVTTNLAAAGTQNAAMKLFADVDESCFVGGMDELESAGVLLGVEECAAIVRDDPALLAVITGEPAADFLEALAGRSPRFQLRFARLLHEYGHRGRGETELANLSFSDDPAQLIRAVAAAAGQDPRPRPRPPVPSGAIARRLVLQTKTWLQRRERARDAVVRVTHGLRLAVREHGQRLTRDGHLDDPGDVFHLTLDELFVPSGQAVLVPRRRSERERLAKLRLPNTFSGSWEPVPERSAGSGPVRLQGLGASLGVARGPVRVLLGADDHLEPGEVLVAHVTDVGWTPLFGGAAAVVTDVGGALSHAAVVAREYGIPCVVSTQEATSLLVTGQLVEVDGGAGTVTTVTSSEDRGRRAP